MNNNSPLGHIHEHPNYGQPDEEIDQIFEVYQSVKSLFSECTITVFVLFFVKYNVLQVIMLEVSDQ